ncbi:hypothetical protein CVT24_006464 [Panaeolus cyanescens]|uniref:Uncharacterized protein n=1 Tax=Panaeolus cyanescens TaxID=181874 RepID=A0A409WIP1_9AGAR|nr:hypothetical protein CVT24_006464 [Panaeolus cyanescens]
MSDVSTTLVATPEKVRVDVFNFFAVSDLSRKFVSDAGQDVENATIVAADKINDVETSGDPTVGVFSMDDLYEVLVYIPRPTGRTIVRGARHNIYNRPGDEALHAISNRHLESLTWVPIMSWRNSTPEPQHFEQSYTTSLTITEGREVSRGFDLGASYRGFSFGINSSVRTFSARETSEAFTTSRRITVAANSHLVFYQRRYDFRDETTFINDAWGREWNVGPWGGYSPLTRLTSRVKIMAEEFFTSTVSIPPGPMWFDLRTVNPAPIAPVTRRRENVTSRARDAIANMGA